MQVAAKLKYARISPQKCRLVADMVRGQPVGQALSTLRFPPKKGAALVRKVHIDCRATIGEVGNDENSLIVYGKAGAKRWRGIRPTVRGVVMNPVDHPHGGGEGKSKGGRHPVTPWGVPTLGKRTRRKHKESDKLIVRGRRRGKEKR